MYHHAIWFAARKDGKADWMAKLLKSGGKWVFSYRFRYYNHDKAFDSADEKHWYTATSPDDSPEELAKLEKCLTTLMLPLLRAANYEAPQRVDLQCEDSDPKFFFELASCPWVNVKMLDKEEAKKQGLIP